MSAARTKLVLEYCHWRAGIEVEGFAGEFVNDFKGIAGKLPGGDGVVLGRVVLITGGVGEEIDDANFRGASEFGEILADRVVERELALLLEEQNSGSGELLGDGADGVGHRGLGLNRWIDAREAEGLGVDDLAILNDADGGRGHSGVGEDLFGEGSDFLVRCLRGELLGRELLRGSCFGRSEGRGENGGEDEAHACG